MEYARALQSGDKNATSELWVIKINGLSRTVDSEVHISRVIIAYTLEQLSSLTYITHDLQVIVNCKKKY